MFVFIPRGARWYPLLLLLLPAQASALSLANSQVRPLVAVDQTGADKASTVTPDLFTGGFTYAIPIEIPRARREMQPDMSIVYRSANGNGWLGVGWSLEFAAIERSTRRGLRYDADEFVLRNSEGSADLLRVPSGEFRAVIERSFTRVRKLTDAGGRPYFEATDRNGLRYQFGPTAASRQDDPANAGRIFRWLLERVEEPNGNAMTFSYVKDFGAVYPDRVDFGSGPSAAYVKFYRESRGDTGVSYATGFGVRMRYRLRTIEVVAGGVRQRAYRLVYLAGDIAGRSSLSSIQQFGANAIIDAAGAVTGGDAFPAWSFGYHAGGTPSTSGVAGPIRYVDGNSDGASHDVGRVMTGDFNGDGRTDLVAIDGWNGWYAMSVYYGSASGFAAPVPGPTIWVPGDHDGLVDVEHRFKLGDFNGDGRTDLAMVEGWNSSSPMSVYYATSTGFAPRVDGPVRFVGGGHDNVRFDSGRVMVGDFNGDGRADLIAFEGWNGWAPMSLYLSNGTGFDAPRSGPTMWAPGDSAGIWDVIARFKLGDWNGDGMTDLGFVEGWNSWSAMSLFLSTGTGFSARVDGPVRFIGGGHDNVRFDSGRLLPGDFNGDGRTDLIAIEGWGQCAPMTLYLANGSPSAPFDAGLSTGPVTCPGGDINALYTHVARFKVGDWNGDGRTDVAVVEGWNGSYAMSLYPSLGDGFGARVSGPIRLMGTEHVNVRIDCARVFVGDVNGDGKDDLSAVEGWGSYSPMSLYLSPTSPTGLIASLSNGQGVTSTIVYAPSTVYSNTRLPVAMQTVSSVTTVVRTFDGTTTSAVTSVTYAGGYMHLQERDFRGFAYARVVQPATINNKRTIIETWFHQGNGVSAAGDDPAVPTGYAKGKPWKVKESDRDAPSNYVETLTTYWADAVGVGSWSPADGAAPWFTPVRLVDSTLYEGGVAVRQTRTEYSDYDDFGNVEREQRYGDLADPSDDTTVLRTFQPNADAWIVSLPATVDVYHDGTRVAGQSFYYDGVTPVLPSVADAERAAACGVASLNSRPTKGNPTRIVSWSCYATTPNTACTEEVHPERRLGYDTLGNVVCSRTPRGGVTTIRYDGSATLPVTVKNALGHTTTTTYYGVDAVSQDFGLFGQVKVVTEPTGSATTSYYDRLGRRVRETSPGATRVSSTQCVPPIQPNCGGSNSPPADPNVLDLAVLTWTYGSYGPYGLQYVQNQVHRLAPPVDASTLIDSTSRVTWKETYTDGHGRSVKQRAPGADGRVVLTTTAFDARGAIVAQSLPYFETGEAARFTTHAYDAFGRVVTTNGPSGTVSACYSGGVKVTIDERQHRRRETRDQRGLLVKVEEYRGMYPSCTTEVLAPYATTAYAHDPLGHLTRVTDTRLNQTEVRYDSLGRKRYLRDPDTGEHLYRYDEDGNLVWHQDPMLRAYPAPFPDDRATRLDYDLLGRLLARRHPNGTTAIFSYDEAASSNGVGRLTSSSNDGVSRRVHYDPAGRVTRDVWTFGGSISYELRRSFDALGRVATLSYPTGDIVTYQHDEAGNLISVSPFASFSGFNALGQPTTVGYSNGTRTTYDYYPTDSRLRKQLIEVLVPSTGGCTPANPQCLGGTTFANAASLTYGYDSAGNVTSLTDSLRPERSQTFGYDELNRIVSASSQTFGTLAYQYDEIGNITSKEGVTHVYPPPAQGGAVRPHAIIRTSTPVPGGTDRIFDYDANGNTRYDGERTIAYDLDNRPVSILRGGITTVLAYSADGRRAKKTVGSAVTLYVDRFMECTSAACAIYVFAGDRRVAIKTGADVKYYHPNSLGSTILVTDAAGGTLEEIHYRPFGAAAFDTGAVSMNHKFTGKQLDPETGLYDYGARHYDPQLGRFISPDSIVPDPSNPQELNRYAYALNNPLVYTDPTGHMSLKELFGTPEGRRWLAAGAIITATAVATYVNPAAGGPILVGEISGAISGVRAARQAGGDESKGALFGTAVGGATAAAASFAGGPILGSNPGFWSNVLARAIEGTIVGAGVGASVGYAGGRGDAKDIARGAALGAGVGAVTGAALGAGQNQLARLEQELANKQQALDSKVIVEPAVKPDGTVNFTAKPPVKHPGLHRAAATALGVARQIVHGTRAVVGSGAFRTAWDSGTTGAVLTEAPWLPDDPVKISSRF